MRGASYLSDAYNMSNLRQELAKLGQCLVEISLSVCNLRLVLLVLLSRVDITGLQTVNSTTSHAPRATPTIYCSVLPISLIVTVNFGSCLMIASQEV